MCTVIWFRFVNCSDVSITYHVTLMKQPRERLDDGVTCTDFQIRTQTASAESGVKVVSRKGEAKMQERLRERRRGFVYNCIIWTQDVSTQRTGERA